MRRGSAIALMAVFSALASITVVQAGPRVPEPARSAIKLASITYHVPFADMVSVASCETGGTFNPKAYNRRSGAAGLFQFLRSTWVKTPYGAFSVTDPHANALAAAWLVVEDNGWSEWSCKP